MNLSNTKTAVADAITQTKGAIATKTTDSDTASAAYDALLKEHNDLLKLLKAAKDLGSSSADVKAYAEDINRAESMVSQLRTVLAGLATYASAVQ